MKKVLTLVMVFCCGLALSPARAELTLNNGVLHELWYNLTHDSLPDFATLGVPDHVEVFPNFGQEPRVDGDQPENNNFVVRNTAVVLLPKGGTYVLGTNSDDGSVLWVDGVKVVDNDGTHGAQWRYGTINLNMGAHLVVAGMFEKGGGNVFEVRVREESETADYPIPPELLILPPTQVVAPANGQTGVEFAAPLTLEWAATEYLPADIVSYDVYLGTTNAAGDPNHGDAYYIGSVPVNNPRITVEGLTHNTTYYWRVDAVNADANALWGVTWTFKSMKMEPIITAEPTNVKVGIDCLGVLTITAISGEYDNAGALSYQWFDAATDQPVDGVSSSPDLIAGAGSYYCKVSNSYGAAVSAEARIVEPPHMAVGSLAKGLIGYWSFDVDARDDSDNGVNGTLTGNAKITLGKFGNALECDGQDGAMRSGKQPSQLGIAGASPRSVSCWAYARSWGNRGLYDMGNRTEGQNFSLRLTDGAPMENHWRVQYWGSPYDWDFRTTNPADLNGMNMGGGYTFDCLSNWVHWVHTFDGLTTKIYANGRLIVSYDKVINTADSQDWRIGVYGDGDEWDGWIDDVGLWNRAIRPAEVAALYQAGLAGKPLGGISWAPENITLEASGWVDPAAPLEVTWEKGPLAPCTGVTYTVYILPDENGEPNFANAPALATAAVPPAVVPANTLGYEGKYWLRLDASYGGESEAGTPMYFETIHRVPVFTQQPADVFVLPHETVQFFAQAESLAGEVSYAWFKEVADGDDIQVATGNPGVIAEVDVDDIGMYYCVATNSAGSAASASARLKLKELIGHWTLDAIGDANEVLDSSRFQRHGIALGNQNLPAVVPGMVGNALDFNGLDQWVDIGLLASELGIGGSHPKSVSVWVYPRAFNDGGIWDMGARVSGQNWGLRTESEADGDHGWRVQYWDGDYDFNTNTGYRLYDAPERWNVNRPAPVTFPSKDAWVHFMLSYDGDVTKVYANGRLVVVFPRVLNTGDEFSFRIGAYGSGKGTIEKSFDGIIDDVRLYNYSLTGAEAAELYASVTGVSPVCPEDPLYDFNGDCVTDLADFAIFMASWMECNLEPCDRW